MLHLLANFDWTKAVMWGAIGVLIAVAMHVNAKAYDEEQ
jgi:hypothetical protein